MKSLKLRLNVLLFATAAAVVPGGLSRQYTEQKVDEPTNGGHAVAGLLSSGSRQPSDPLIASLVWCQPEPFTWRRFFDKFGCRNL